jgi:hypothetical protein
MVVKVEKSRRYLGGYNTVQYLEDSGLLDQIICPNLKIFDQIKRCKFRIFNDIPIFRFPKDEDGKRIRPVSQSYNIKDGKSNAYTIGDFTLEEKPSRIVIHCNYQNPTDLFAHQICSFFE